MTHADRAIRKFNRNSYDYYVKKSDYDDDVIIIHNIDTDAKVGDIGLDCIHYAPEIWITTKDAALLDKCRSALLKDFSNWVKIEKEKSNAS